jgi:hypothetical protein
MSVQIETNAVSENFVIDYSEEQVTVRLHPDCTGCFSVHVVDDTAETLEFTLQHDGESCPVHSVSTGLAPREGA